MDNEGDSDTAPKEIPLPRRPYENMGLLIPRRTGSFIIHAIGRLKSKDEKYYSVQPQHLSHYTSTLYQFGLRLDLATCSHVRFESGPSREFKSNRRRIETE